LGYKKSFTTIGNRKWADMSNMTAEFRKKIDRLERNFSVSNVIYKKYKTIFKDLFKDPVTDAIKLHFFVSEAPDN
jgi:hypothetical protein